MARNQLAVNGIRFSLKCTILPHRAALPTVSTQLAPVESEIYLKKNRQFLLIKFFLEHRIFKVFSLEKLSVNLKEEEFITTHVLNSCQGVPLRNSDINPTFFRAFFSGNW